MTLPLTALPLTGKPFQLALLTHEWNTAWQCICKADHVLPWARRASVCTPAAFLEKLAGHKGLLKSVNCHASGIVAV